MGQIQYIYRHIWNISVRRELGTWITYSHRKFRDQIDQLGEVQMCDLYHESYARIQVHDTNTYQMCFWSIREGTNYMFSSRNHLDQGFQPHVLEVLTQVEDMLIAQTSPIL